MQPAIGEPFFAQYGLAQLSKWDTNSSRTQAASRSVAPRPGSTHYRRVSWDRALDLAAGRCARRRLAKPCSIRPDGAATSGVPTAMFCARLRHEQRQHCSYYCTRLPASGSPGPGHRHLDLVARGRRARRFRHAGRRQSASNHPRLIPRLVDFAGAAAPSCREPTARARLVRSGSHPGR